MRTFNFNVVALTAIVVVQLLDKVSAQDPGPASITVLAPDSSFLFDDVESGTLVYTDMTPKGVAVGGQTTYAGLAVGAAEYMTTEPLLNKVAIATTTFAWSVGIVADASHAEYEISETGGAQLLDLECTYSGEAVGECSSVQQGDGNFAGNVTGRPRVAFFTPIILTASASTQTPIPSANGPPPPQESTAKNTTASTSTNSQSTFDQTSQTPTSTTSAMPSIKSSGSVGRDVGKYWMGFLFAVVIGVRGT